VLVLTLPVFSTPVPRVPSAVFDGRAFRTWKHVVFGACVLSTLFLCVMVLAEAVVGDGPRLSPAALTMSAATFAGYVAVAWMVRPDDPSL